MDYARQQRNPSRHLIGIGGVVLFLRFAIEEAQWITRANSAIHPGT